MKKIISTWIYLDSKEEESNYPQVGSNSSSKDFQVVYWKCIIVFFETSLRYNKDIEHILFTNTKEFPKIEGFDTESYFIENNIKIIYVQNKYIVPQSYYGSWNNQFFEFSILESIGSQLNPDDLFLLLDSDCVFTRGIDPLFIKLSKSEKDSFTYMLDYSEGHLINGISRTQMQTIFKDLGLPLGSPPSYSAGEVFFAKGSFISKICNDFPGLWQELLKRFTANEIKFNEEAHVLSFYYYKYKAEQGILNNHVKRCWTNPFIYRNISKTDHKLDILHLPSEKKHGIDSIFKKIIKGKEIKTLDEKKYHLLIKKLLSSNKYFLKLIPTLANKFLRIKNKTD